jgi:hypothetical protein
MPWKISSPPWTARSRRDVEQGRHDQPRRLDTGKAVVMDAGIHKTDVKYDEIIDMSFVESAKT